MASVWVISIFLGIRSSRSPLAAFPVTQDYIRDIYLTRKKKKVKNSLTLSSFKEK